MPYTIQNPPDVIKELPKHAKEIWIAAYNSAYEEYDGDEAKCKATAWAAVKKSYKQEDGSWVELEAELETVDIENVEILAVGTWRGNKTVTITKDDIPAFVESFDELTANKKINYEPPAKLGHSDGQKLLQADGYPAAGWVKSLKAKGEKLIAGFKAVPKKLAEIIKAGGYKKVSAEFYQDYEIGGKTYPWVLKAVSFLGADVPAVKSIADIQAMYSEQSEPEPVIVFVELAEDMSLEGRAQGIRSAFYAQTRGLIRGESWICEVYPDYVIVEKDRKMYQVPFTENGMDITFDVQGAIEVKKEINYVAVKPEAAPAADDTDNQNKQEELMENELRQLLKLDDKADVLAAIGALVEKPETVSLTEHTALQAEVAGLKTKLAERERDERVDNAITAGKITPAQKEWANKYAMSNPEGFDSFIASAPQVVKLGEVGTQGDTTGAVDLTEAEKAVAAQMGISTETLIKAKKEGK